MVNGTMMKLCIAIVAVFTNMIFMAIMNHGNTAQEEGNEDGIEDIEDKAIGMEEIRVICMVTRTVLTITDTVNHNYYSYVYPC